MIENKNVLAIVPARGGSKGIPKKNLIKVCGISLIERVSKVVDSVREIDKCIVSTDSKEIAEHAMNCGIDVPFYRPSNLSGDFVSDWEVLNHGLLEVERLARVTYDFILMLQPTSPLRKPEDVSAALKLLVDKNFSSVWSLSETDLKYHPLKQVCLNDHSMNLYDPDGKGIIARQQLNKTYHRNGVVYAFTRDCILKNRDILGNKPGGYVMEGDHISIDTWEDVQRVERCITENNS